MGVWSSGMIFASVARGSEFDSWNTPYPLLIKGGIFVEINLGLMCLLHECHFLCIFTSCTLTNLKKKTLCELE